MDHRQSYKWQRVAGALYDVESLYNHIEGDETSFVNNIDDGTDVEGWQISSVERTLHKIRLFAHEALKELRAAEVIVSAPGEVDARLPRFSDAAGAEYEAGVQRATAVLLDRLEPIMAALHRLDSIRRDARAECVDGKKYIRPETEIDSEAIEECLLILDAMVPMALEKVEALRALIPA